MIPYEDFLRAKVKLAESWGYDVAESEINAADEQRRGTNNAN